MRAGNKQTTRVLHYKIKQLIRCFMKASIVLI